MDKGNATVRERLKYVQPRLVQGTSLSSDQASYALELMKPHTITINISNVVS